MLNDKKKVYNRCHENEYEIGRCCKTGKTLAMYEKCVTNGLAATAVIKGTMKKHQRPATSFDATRTNEYRQRLLGKQEFLKRKRSAHSRTAGTRRAAHFVAHRLDAVLAAYRKKT